MKSTSLTLTLIAGAMALVLAIPPADAGERNRSGKYATGGGRSGTYSSNIERSRGSVNRQGSITTQSGETYSRSVSGTYDKDTGTVNRSVTGPGGNTRTDTGTYNKDTQTYSGTVTGPKGNTAQQTTVYDKNTKSTTSTYTGPGGKTATGTTTYNPETGTAERTITGAGGKSRSVTLTPERQQ